MRGSRPENIFAKNSGGVAMTGTLIQEQIDHDDVAGIDEIEVQVQSRLHGRVGDLHLLVCGEGIVLQGHAHSFYAKQVAQHAVMNVTSLPILRNEIEVC
jgi:hypothetical protein